MRSDRKQTILFIIILLILSMGIGYAFLTTTLSIDGTGDIDSANWDVHFENVQIESGSVIDDQVINPAEISVDGQTISYYIKLNEPGDFYGFTVDIVNDGSLDAVIDDIIIKVNDEPISTLPTFLEYYFGWDDGDEILIDDCILAHDYRKLDFAIIYRYDVTPDELPDSNQSLNVSIQIVYKQAGKPYYLYTVDSFTVSSGEPLPSGVTTYDNYLDANNSFGHDTFIRLLLRNGKVMEKHVGFIYNGNVYYIKGGDGGEAYNENNTILDESFGNSNCRPDDLGRNFYWCSNNGMYAYSYMNGKVSIHDDSVYGCAVVGNLSHCDNLEE